MKNDVTVVVEDKLIFVDGESVNLENGISLAPGHESMYALQWHNGRGEIEFYDDINQQFDSVSYEEEVAPYVEQFNVEKSKIEELERIRENELNRKYNVEERMRMRRDELIAETDYFVLPDYVISDKKLDEILAYRQALRDITEQEGWPRNIVWPEKPEV